MFINMRKNTKGLMVLLEYEVRTPIQVGGSIVTSLVVDHNYIGEGCTVQRRAVTHGAVESEH